MAKKTTIKEKLKKLKEGESLVVLTKVKGGYFLGIGDKWVSNSWAITHEEAVKLYDLLGKHVLSSAK